MPRLRVTVSTTFPPSSSNSTVLSPNSFAPTQIKSDTFEGDVFVRIKDFTGISADGKERRNPEGKAYFDSASRKGKTWSIFVRGRFLEDIDGDDLVFGNVFEKPIRDSLPWGASVAVKFMKCLDPTLDSDFYGDKPWALSPLLATVPYLSIQPHSSNLPLPKFSLDDLKPLQENTLDGLIANLKRSGADVGKLEREDEASWASSGKARKAWVGEKENRKRLRITRGDLVSIDFVQAFLDLNDLSVSLPSVGFRVNLLKRWDGQPVNFICRNRSGTKTFFSVVFDIAET